MRTALIARTVVALSLLLVLAAAVYIFFPSPSDVPTVVVADAPAMGKPAPAERTDRFFHNNRLTVWWDREQLPGKSTVALTSLKKSNIHPEDYVGAEQCRKCHSKNYEAWSGHSHRWMNALANDSTVKGDFSGVAISYLGGTAKFFRRDDGYKMQFDRDGIQRVYDISQTIGSRFFQYYVGRLESGPEPAEHPAFAIDHVMLFGFWIDRNEWVPAVHVGYDEAPDGKREDPFAATLPVTPLSPYFQCNSCHTTFALGDELTRNFYSLGRHSPVGMHWNMPGYLSDSRSDLLPHGRTPRDVPNGEVETLLTGMQQYSAPEQAINLGVSCEACHLGCKDHAEGKQEKPSFFPVSNHLNVEAETLTTGREHQNVNWTCARCHAGERPYFAGGMSTWNSTEYTDASKGACYSQMKCIDCHDPHQAIGKQWRLTERENDASCLKCHEQLRDEKTLTAHTHHAADSEGSRCMNCHMPRLNEGLQDVVRTHTIFSPTDAKMLEANHLNACNICHVEQPIDWTLGHLKDWYGASYTESKIATNYPDRNGPTAMGWLRSENEAVRLAATDAVARSNDTTCLPTLVDVLDDPYLLNRQFARIGIEKRFNLQLSEFGYRFYMTPEERKESIANIRRHLLSDKE